MFHLSRSGALRVFVLAGVAGAETGYLMKSSESPFNTNYTSGVLTGF